LVLGGDKRREEISKPEWLDDHILLAKGARDGDDKPKVFEHLHCDLYQVRFNS
jgi:hypothetical protein